MKKTAYIAGAVALAGVLLMLQREPRGIRNKNPLNIELGDNWQGLAAVQTDGRFAQFTDPRYGYRAAARILDSYGARGIVTIREIIETWAPSFENNTNAYVDSVARKMGADPDSTVTFGNMAQLFAAMTKHENGKNPHSIELIREGISWA